MTRRVLLVSYWYPPAVGAAAERMGAFAHYLPDHGWHVEVLTARAMGSGKGRAPVGTRGEGGRSDNEAAIGAADPAHRPEVGPSALSMEGQAGRRVFARPTVHTVPDPWASAAGQFADYDPRVRPSRLRAWLRELVFPDRFIAWQRSALRVGRKVLRARAPFKGESRGTERSPPTAVGGLWKGHDGTRRFAAILASFPPASVVQLALRLHRESGVPLVLDFRDRWIGPGGYEPKRAAARRRHEALEREAVLAASAVVAVSEAMARDIVERFGIEPDRVVAIPNGYEPMDSPPVQSAASRPTEPGDSGMRVTHAAQDVEMRPARKSIQGAANPATAPPKPTHGRGRASTADSEATEPRRPTAAPLVIAHVGTVIARNRPDLFLRSLAELHRRGRLDGLRFDFVGNLSSDYVASLGLSGVVHASGLVARDEARRRMAAADALLLLVGEYVGRWGYNAKLFEYLQTGRPILCLEKHPGSNDRRLLESAAPALSFFAALDDPNAIAAQLDKLRAASLAPQGSLPVDRATLDAYRRDRLTARLAATLDRWT